MCTSVDLDQLGAYVTLLIPIIVLVLILIVTDSELLPRFWEILLGISVGQKQHTYYSYEYHRPTISIIHTSATQRIVYANKIEKDKSHSELV